MRAIIYFIIAVTAYLIGNCSGAYIISKIMKHDDIRKHGSGNPGTANMLRTYGKSAAGLTFVIDGLKGVLAVLIGRWIGGEFGACVAAVAVVIGHVWPIILGLRGGKGVATGVCALIAIDWRSGLIVFVVGLIIIIITRMFSIGAIAVCVVYPFVSIFLFWKEPYKIITIFILCGLVVYSHRTNIKRLLMGMETKAKLKR